MCIDEDEIANSKWRLSDPISTILATSAPDNGNDDGADMTETSVSVNYLAEFDDCLGNTRDSPSRRTSLTSEDADKSQHGSVRSCKGSVSFSTVRVHQHRLTLGDNPAVSRGIPLTLDWQIEDSETFDLELFEAVYGRKDLCCFSSDERKAIARQDHSRDSLVRVRQEVKAIQYSRERSKYESASPSRNTRETHSSRKAKLCQASTEPKLTDLEFTNWF